MIEADDKGFSLIELILVIAIMAVLTVIIAPNLIKYLNKSKRETDKKNLDEIRHQVATCISDASADDKEIDVIAGEDGIKRAEYVLAYNTSQGKVVATAGSNGVSEFAGLLTSVFYDTKVGSSINKEKNKVLIEISGTKSGGYTTEVRFTS